MAAQGGSTNQVSADGQEAGDSLQQVAAFVAGEPWVFAVHSRLAEGYLSGQHVLLVSGSDEHVCSKSFAPAVAAEPFAGGVLRDAQGNPIANECWKRVLMRIGKDRKLLKAALRVANVRFPL